MGDVVEYWLKGYNNLNDALKAGKMLPIEHESHLAMLNRELNANVLFCMDVAEMTEEV